MTIGHSWSYYLKRIFSKVSTWIILFLHLGIIGFFFWTTKEAGGNAVIINTNNDLFREIFWGHLLIPFLAWTTIVMPISWLFWWTIDDIGQETQTDGTDLFFLSTQASTSREQVFWGKVISLVSLSTILYLLLYALPFTIFLWKIDSFALFTNLQIFSYLTISFLAIPFLFFLPLVIFFFSLCSLKSVWYFILKWLLRILIIINILVGYLIARAFLQGREQGWRIINWFVDLLLWLDQNYLLVISVIVGVIFLLACLTLPLAYKKFQEEDLD